MSLAIPETVHMRYKYPKVIVTGDSISAGAFYKGGYASELVSQYACYADIVNRGLPGYNTTQLLQMIAETRGFKTHSDDHVDLFIVHIGTNDSCMTGNLSVPHDRYKFNLGRIIDSLRHFHPSVFIIFLSPAAVQQDVFMDWLVSAGWTGDFDTRESEYTKTFVATMSDVCKEKGVEFIDCFEAFHEEVKRGATMDQLLYDGLHYTPLGNSVVAKRLMSLIHLHMPHLSPLYLDHPYPFCLEYARDEGVDIEQAHELSKHFNTMTAKHSILERYASALRSKGYPDSMIDIPL